jgi:hypothetical protein
VTGNGAREVLAIRYSTRATSRAENYPAGPDVTALTAPAKTLPAPAETAATGSP